MSSGRNFPKRRRGIARGLTCNERIAFFYKILHINSMDTTVTGTSPADGRVGNAPFGLTGLAVIVLIAVVGFVFVAVALERARTPIMTPDRLHASVALAVSSEAYVKMPGSETFQEIVGSVPLEAGAEITTSPSGRAFIASPNGALTIVKENTHIIISMVRAPF